MILPIFLAYIFNRYCCLPSQTATYGGGLLMMMRRAKDVTDEAGFINDLMFKGEY